MKHVTSKWQTSEDKRMLKLTEENGNETCHMTQDKNSRNMECRNTNQTALCTQWTNVLGKQYENKFVVHYTLKIQNEVGDEIDTKHDAEDAMIKKRLCVVSDISMKNNQMGGPWKLFTFDNKTMWSR